MYKWYHYVRQIQEKITILHLEIYHQQHLPFNMPLLKFLLVKKNLNFIRLLTLKNTQYYLGQIIFNFMMLHYSKWTLILANKKTSITATRQVYFENSLIIKSDIWLN